MDPGGCFLLAATSACSPIRPSPHSLGLPGVCVCVGGLPEVRAAGATVTPFSPLVPRVTPQKMSPFYFPSHLLNGIKGNREVSVRFQKTG